ncbi:MAG: DUF4388 domain-containing protein [Bdellovibrionota bacterium]
MSVSEVMLVFLEGENEGVEIKLTPPRELTLGRSEECDVFLGEKKISRKHLTVIVRKDAVIARDLGSTNGSFVNKNKISEVVLQDGDGLKLGASVIQVLIKEADEDIVVEAPTAIDMDESEAPTGTNPRKKAVQEISLDEALEEDNIKIDTDDTDDDDEEDDEPIVEYEPSVVYEPSEPDLDDKDSSASLNLDEAMDEEPSLSMSEEVSDPGLGLSEESSLMEESASMEEEEEVSDEPLDLDGGGEDDEFSMSMDDEKSDDGGHEFSMEQNVDSEPSLELDLTGDQQQIDFSVPEYQDQDHEENSEVSQIKGKTLSGDLAAMSLADLLQNIDQNKKTGYVELVNKQSQQKGTALIQAGKVVSASVGSCVGKKAIYRLITWKKGNFEFHPLEKSDEKFKKNKEKPIEDSIESLLMEGFRQYDELKKIKKVLPSPEQKLKLKKNLSSPLSKLHPRVLDLLQVIMAHSTVQDVLDNSDSSDLETSKVIFFLIKKGYLDVID